MINFRDVHNHIVNTATRTVFQQLDNEVRLHDAIERVGSPLNVTTSNMNPDDVPYLSLRADQTPIEDGFLGP